MQIPASTIEVMMEYDWPGNVRELQHAIERAVLLTPNFCIEPEHLKLKKQPISTGKPTTNQSLPLKKAMDEFERSYIENALRKYRGNITRTAKRLGISRKTLYERMQRLGIETDHYREEVQ